MDKVTVEGFVERSRWEEFINPRTTKWSYGIRRTPDIFRFAFKSIKGFWSDRDTPVKVRVTFEEISDG